MIVTVTPNPSLDLLFECESLVWDDANRVESPRVRPGGQGVNVTRAVRELGGASTAIALLGGNTGAELERALSAEGTPVRRIDIAGETRVFAGVRETGTGRSLLLNPRGPHIAAQDVERILAEVVAAIRSLQPVWVACCGSLPPGLPADFYARIGQVAVSCGARFAPDCDGEALRLAAPHAQLLVPNQHEAERLLDRRIEGVEDAGRAARELVRRGARFAAITMGAQGAVLGDAKSVWYAEPPVLQAGSAVGAGDAFLAAIMIALRAEADPGGMVRRAVAAGAAVLQSRGSNLLARLDTDALYDIVKARPLF